MLLRISFANEFIELDPGGSELVGFWEGPESLPKAEVAAEIRENLASPLAYPTLRQAVVEGDRVVIALDPSVDNPKELLEAVVEELAFGSIEREQIEIVLPWTPTWNPAEFIPDGVSLQIHNPDDRAGIAYLSSTNSGRRIYLNRRLVDADLVFPIGRLGFDFESGYRGPWTTLLPGLSDRATQEAFSSQSHDELPKENESWPLLEESVEVGWLLGSQLQLAVLPGKTGLRRAIAGRFDAVRTAGIQALKADWTFSVQNRADLVVAGIGPEGGIEAMSIGVSAAMGLVRRGGKIALLTRTTGEFGPACQKLLGVEDPTRGPSILKEAVGESDYAIARRISRALAWADVFLLSNLDAQIVEDLSISVIEKPEQAKRLVSNSTSCIFLNQAELTRVEVREE